MLTLAERLKRSFQDKDYRHGYVDEFLNNRISTQIKVLREQREWTQSELAERAEMKQSAVSRLEDVNYSSWNIKTLKRLAEAFDLTLKVSIEDFGSTLVDISNFRRNTLERISFSGDPVFKKGGKAEITEEIKKSFYPERKVVGLQDRFQGRDVDTGAKSSFAGLKSENRSSRRLSENIENVKVTNQLSRL